MEAIEAASMFQQFRRIQVAFQVLAALGLTSFMYPMNTNVHDGQYFDYIVVGGGTAGCVVASRLAQMDPKNEVLLIEAGGDPPFETTLPKLIPFVFSSNLVWDYNTVEDGYSQLSNKHRVSKLQQGKMLGGTSSLSYMLYSPENKNDYDKWSRTVGDESWSWKDVLPYFNKIRREDNPLINSTCDAFEDIAPIVISKDQMPESLRLLEAFRELGHDIRNELNSDASLGYAPQQYFIGDGVRQSTAQSYLARAKFDNLKVMKNAVVTKIIINEQKTATGVRVLLRDKTYVTVNCKKEVILSAGAINTPKILMLSGIGPKEHLENKEIPVIVDMNVGKNLIDHIAVMIVYNLLGMQGNPVPENPHLFPEPAFQGSVKIDKENEAPEYGTKNFINLPSNMMTFCVVNYEYKYEICNNLFNKVNSNEMLWSLVVNLHPDSRGEVKLKSKYFGDAPIVDPKYFSNRTDLYKHVKYVKDFIKVGNTTLFKSIDAVFVDPKLRKCKDLVFGSDEYWECYVLGMMTTERHFSGTCAMGSVVDSKLKVRDVRGLRIADASVIPVTISGDIETVVIMVAEKLVDIIKNDNSGV